MCTVSFYKDQSRVIITSNRDEKMERPFAKAPKSEDVNNTKIFFPKDPLGGGTWFAVNEHGCAFVLLNGALVKHIPNPPYKNSRGIILLNLASAIDFEVEWNVIDLTNIEPFTMIAYVKGGLAEVRWNGIVKEYQSLNESPPKIWSSATLYEPEIIQKRKIWFNIFLQNKNGYITPEDLIEFHTQTEIADFENGIIINRNGKTLTKKCNAVYFGR